ncbi:hypothetical protein CMK11_06845 [Candidatus Poribacteria bacterium]|nr:hypothetical protein [Candidatus Poribacteria bacterium]
MHLGEDDHRMPRCDPRRAAVPRVEHDADVYQKLHVPIAVRRPRDRSTTDEVDVLLSTVGDERDIDGVFANVDIEVGLRRLGGPQL